MAIQQEISGELMQGFVGKTLPVIIDRYDGDYYIGRTEFDSPEVDCEVLIEAPGEELCVGSFYSVCITRAEEFDLYATIAKK
jgi:ribosomal protein S12 methylthiotransferase